MTAVELGVVLLLLLLLATAVVVLVVMAFLVMFGVSAIPETVQAGWIGEAPRSSRD